MKKRPRSSPFAPPARLHQGVYVNYTLDVTHVDVVGLDLDHTLAVYDDPEVNAIAFAETCRNLLELGRYPPRVGDLEYDHSTVARGLVADTQSGILVKLDHRDYVCRALRGNRYLRSEDIAQSYGNAPISCDGRYQVQSPFDLPAAALFASLQVQNPDAGQSEIQNFLSDIVTMLDHAHRFGELKRRIVAEPARFIERRPGVDEMILRFRGSGKKTFLLTNSGSDYTVDLLDHLFPRSAGWGGWEAMFDAVFVDANKPFFFDPATGPVAEHFIADGRAGPALWRSGSAGALEQLFETAGDRILYIGDNPAADCVAARARGWRTALVVPELETDPGPLEEEAEDFEGWGSVLWESAQPTRFARVIQQSADVFAARVEQILAPGPDAVFRGL